MNESTKKTLKYSLYAILFLLVLLGGWVLIQRPTGEERTIATSDTGDALQGIGDLPFFEPSKIDLMFEEQISPIKESVLLLRDKRTIQSEPAYRDLYGTFMKNIYHEMQPVVRGVIERLLEEGIQNSWPGEDEAIRWTRSQATKGKYIELRVWEINQDYPGNDRVRTFVEMKADGSEYGRIVQMKDKKKHGYYIDFYNKKIISIRKLSLEKTIGPELLFHNDSDIPQIYAYYNEEGMIIGPAFYWDREGNIAEFEFFAKPERRGSLWPPDILMKPE